MFGNNHKISHIQMERQYQLTFLAPFLLFVSKELQGGMGILAVFLAMPLVWLALVWMKRRSKTHRKRNQTTGRVGWKLKVFLGQVFLVVAGVFVSTQASRLITEYMVPGISRELVLVIFVLASLTLGSQLEARGRFAEIAWPAVSSLVGIFFFFAFWQGGQRLLAENLGNVDLGQVRGGFFDFSWSELWKNVLILLTVMLGSFFVCFADVGQGEMNNCFLFRMIGKLMIWLVLAILLQQMYFGAHGAEDLSYPLLDLMSGVKLPGNFVRRLDLIFLTVLLFVLLFTMGSICFYSGHLWKKINISMGRLPIVALIFALVLTLSGCQIVEPEKRAYPLVLGIDWSGEEYAIYLAMAKMAQSTGQEKSGAEQDANMIVLHGKDSKEIQEIYDATEELFLDVGHVQAVVFGEQLLEDEGRTFSILKELEQNHDLGNSPYVFGTEDMEGLFSKNGTQIESLGDYLKGLYENRVPQRVPRTLLDVYRSLHNENALPALPKLLVSEEKMELND